ncbi:MAG: histidine kinase [Limisphaerales bacterium]
MNDVSESKKQAGAPAPAVWRLSRFWWLVLFFWLVVSLASALEMSLMHMASRSQVLLETFFRLLAWVFMTLLVIRISATYTFDRTNWRRTIWVYLAGCAVSMGVIALLAYFGPPPWIATPAGGSRSMAFAVLLRLTYQLPAFWGLVAVAHAVRLYELDHLRQLRESELQARLMQTRLRALQLQLNPHFLFNTLNSIASLVHENPATAERMIEALSNLLRLALTNTGRQQVTVREELHLLDQYLLIARIRFGERLHVKMQINETVLEDEVPVLILQPLVENAVKYGVETQLGPSQVQISAQPAGTGDFLCMEVSNDGPVYDLGAGKIEERIGLTNTRARLREMFGAQASLELQPRTTGGFVAQILIPRLTAARHETKPELLPAI